MWVHWGLREEEKIWGVIVQHRYDIDPEGVIGLCLLSVDGDEFELSDRRERVRSMTKSCVPGCPKQGRGIGKVRGESIPF